MIMNVLFIFSRHSRDQRDSTLTKDLADAFYTAGHNITVATLLEKREKQGTSLINEHGYDVLRVRTGNYFNTGKIEKGITVLTLARALRTGIINEIGERRFDLIITHTPFVANHKIIKPLKKHFNCPAFLLLWDLFPQNAVDLGILKNLLLIRYFQKQEKLTFESYEQIFCTSLGNVNYLQINYPYINQCKINLQYNYATVKPIPSGNKSKIRKELGYLDDDIIALFGGNMGVPQKLENMIILAQKALHLLNARFLFIGSGTETERIKALAVTLGLNNIKFINQLSREDYEVMSSVCDLGLVSLDERFTIPNFPSKTADYFKLQLPILASLDSCASKDYGYFLTNIAKAGRFALAGDSTELFNCYMELYSSADLRKELGVNGRKFYEQELDATIACKKICNIAVPFSTISKDKHNK